MSEDARRQQIILEIEEEDRLIPPIDDIDDDNMVYTPDELKRIDELGAMISPNRKLPDTSKEAEIMFRLGELPDNTYCPDINKIIDKIMYELTQKQLVTTSNYAHIKDIILRHGNSDFTFVVRLEPVMDAIYDEYNQRKYTNIFDLVKEAFPKIKNGYRRRHVRDELLHSFTFELLENISRDMIRVISKICDEDTIHYNLGMINSFVNNLSDEEVERYLSDS